MLPVKLFCQSCKTSSAGSSPTNFGIAPWSLFQKRFSRVRFLSSARRNLFIAAKLISLYDSLQNDHVSCSTLFPPKTPSSTTPSSNPFSLVPSRNLVLLRPQFQSLFVSFPVWLKYVPRISFRTDNGPLKRAMQGFTEKILGMIKSEQLFESHGGPIILSQIENEYGAQNKLQGAASQNYVNWAAKRAVEMGTGVPWVMCKEDGNWRGWSKRKNHPYISKKLTELKII